MANEGVHSESRLAEMEAQFTKRCNSLETKFMSALGESKKETAILMEKYLGNMIAKADAINNNLNFKLGQNAVSIVTQMTQLLANSNGDNNTNDPPCKYPRIQQDGTAMDNITHPPGPTPPASPQNLFPKGKDSRASEKSNARKGSR
jgi:hypothetical protein